jgi:hypothetical protein
VCLIVHILTEDKSLLFWEAWTDTWRILCHFRTIWQNKSQNQVEASLPSYVRNSALQTCSQMLVRSRRNRRGEKVSIWWRLYWLKQIGYYYIYKSWFLSWGCKTKRNFCSETYKSLNCFLFLQTTTAHDIRWGGMVRRFAQQSFEKPLSPSVKHLSHKHSCQSSASISPLSSPTQN